MNTKACIRETLAMLALLLIAGCQDTQSGSPPPQQALAAAATHEPMQPTDKSIERMRGSDRWAVAALKCDRAEISGAGTRSQTLTLTATVLNTSDPKLSSPLNLEQYVGDDIKLVSGGTYLVLLVGTGRNDDPIAWSIVQSAAMVPTDAAKEVSRLKGAVEAALKK